MKHALIGIDVFAFSSNRIKVFNTFSNWSVLSAFGSVPKRVVNMVFSLVPWGLY